MTVRRFRVYMGVVALLGLGVVALLVLASPPRDPWRSVALMAGCGLVLYLAWRAAHKALREVQWSKRTLDSPFMSPAFQDTINQETHRLRPAIVAATIVAWLVFMLLGGASHRVARVTFCALWMLMVGGFLYLVFLRARRGR